MPDIPMPVGLQPIVYPEYSAPPPLLQTDHSAMRTIELTPPGSVATHVSQINTLFDNDFVNIGTDAVAFHSIGTPNLALDALMNDAAQFVPVEAGSFGSGQDIGTFIGDAGASLKAFADAIEAGQAA